MQTDRVRRDVQRVTDFAARAYGRGMSWLASTSCPLSVCRGSHRLVWDGLSLPDPARLYAYACPFKYRMTLVDVAGLTWVRQGTREAFELQGLAAQLVTWEREPLFRENDDGTPY